MLWKEKEKKNPEKLEAAAHSVLISLFKDQSQIYQCLHRCPAVLVSGQALPPAPSQLTAAPGAGLGDFSPGSCSQNNQQGWLNQMERPLFPCSTACGTEGRNSARLPAWGYGWRSLWRSPSQHQRSHANSIYQVTGTKYPSKVMFTYEPKRKNSRSCIYSHYHFYSSLQDRVIPSDDWEEVLMKRCMAERLMDNSHTSEKIFPSLKSRIAGAVGNTQAESMVCLW